MIDLDIVNPYLKLEFFANVLPKCYINITSTTYFGHFFLFRVFISITGINVKNWLFSALPRLKNPKN